jgi:hypothetical protein
MKTLHSPIDYKGKHIEGEVSSLNGKKVQGLPFVHQLIIDDKDNRLISCNVGKWSAERIRDPEL